MSHKMIHDLTDVKEGDVFMRRCVGFRTDSTFEKVECTATTRTEATIGNIRYKKLRAQSIGTDRWTSYSLYVLDAAEVEKGRLHRVRRFLSDEPWTLLNDEETKEVVAILSLAKHRKEVTK